MKAIRRFRGIRYFLAGALSASILILGFISIQNAIADQYACIRTDLDAQGMTENIPDLEFTTTYDIPQCYANNNYAAQRVYMYGDQVAAHYAKVD